MTTVALARPRKQHAVPCHFHEGEQVCTNAAVVCCPHAQGLGFLCSMHAHQAPCCANRIVRS